MIICITGASSGLGLHTAQALARHGHTVIAGARSFGEAEEKSGADGIIRLPLDVTDPGSVSAFFKRANELVPEIDCVIHCAAFLMLGSCEETKVAEYARVLDTDFLGMVRVNQAVLPQMRRQGHGKIVMFSSINGLLGIPFQSAYTAAKHAVEGYAECLQMETMDFGIQVCLVEPGDHRSGSDSYRKHTAGMQPDSPYRTLFQRGTSVIHRDETNGSDPDRLGEKLAQMIEKKRLPFRRRIASPDQHLAVFLHDLLPGFLNNRILYSYYLRPGRKG